MFMFAHLALLLVLCGAGLLVLSLVGDGAFVLVHLLTLGLLDGNTLRVLDFATDRIVDGLTLRLEKRGFSQWLEITDRNHRS